MKFRRGTIEGLWVVELEKHQDDRGYFARTWCQEEFRAQGLNPSLAQCSTSFNRKMGTLRGMHWQEAPHAEAKLIRCTRGAIYDMALDLRPDSATFKQWMAIKLTADGHEMFYIGEGFAHGFLTLADETEVFYQMSESFHPESARGLRWNDPAFRMAWPETPERIISERDANYPDFHA